MTEVTNTTFESLKLLPGQALSLEFDGYDGQRDRSVLVGYRAGRSIIITTPTKNGVAISLKPKMTLKVRLFVNQINGACGFETVIQHVSVIPFPHLHLAVPEKLHIGEVRKAMRAKVHIICSVLLRDATTKKAVSAVIDDLSDNGARIHSKNLQLEVENEIDLVFKVLIGTIEKMVSVTAIVRSVTSDVEKGNYYGLQFLEVSEQDTIAMHAYVLSQIHKA
jgi:c-di-GMP-binding flagellar brake protein YcgR